MDVYSTKGVEPAVEALEHGDGELAKSGYGYG